MITFINVGSYGRIGLASEGTFNARLLFNIFNFTTYFGLNMEEICNGLHLTPSGSFGNFPSGSGLYGFDYRDADNMRHTKYKSVNFEMINNAVYELKSVESGVVDIVTSESKRITFRLRNPTAFTTKFTLTSSLQITDGFQVGDNLTTSVVIYPQEAVEIEATISANTAAVGARNRFTLHATNGCVHLYAYRNLTVIEQVSIEFLLPQVYTSSVYIHHCRLKLETCLQSHLLLLMSVEGV